MHRWAVTVLVGLVVLAAATVLYHASETRRLHVRVDHLAERERYLERELETALRDRDAVAAQLARFATDQEARRAADHARPTPPPTEGARLAVIGLNACLREEGFGNLRVLEARAIEKSTLLGVEIVEHDPGQLTTAFIIAECLDIAFDRSRAVVELRLRGGVRIAGDERQPLSAAGLLLEIPSAEEALWRGRLAHLVTFRGEAAAPDAVSPAADMDQETQALWLDRLDRLLAIPAEGLRYRISKFGGLQESAFIDVLCLGYDHGKTLAFAVEAKRMEVVADAREGVGLRFRDGVLRQRSGETKIAAEGYCVRLADVTREVAMDVLAGMVVER